MTKLEKVNSPIYKALLKPPKKNSLQNQWEELSKKSQNYQRPFPMSTKTKDTPKNSIIAHSLKNSIKQSMSIKIYNKKNVSNPNKTIPKNQNQ